MMNTFKNIAQSAVELLKNLSWCMSLSWQASKFYSMLRIASDIITPILMIATAFMGKLVLNLLTEPQLQDHALQKLLPLLAVILLLALIRKGMLKAVQYCQSMHEDALRNELSLVVMEHSLRADLECFDNPTYYTLTAANDYLQLQRQFTFLIHQIMH